MRAVPAVAAIARAHPRVETRWEAVEALGTIGGDEAIAELIELVDDDDALVANRAAAGLGAMQRVSALNALLTKASHPNPEVRARVVRALWELGPLGSVPVVIAARRYTLCETLAGEHSRSRQRGSFRVSASGGRAGRGSRLSDAPLSSVDGDAHDFPSRTPRLEFC